MTRFLFILLVINVGSISAEIRLLGTGSIPGTAIDHSGLPQKFETGGSQNLIGGISAIDYTGQDNLYLALPDRGPDDGAVPWKCRVQTIRLEIHPEQSPAIQLYLVSTTLLRDEEDRNFIGKATAFSTTQKTAERFDPEGIRLQKDGSFFISDEYGPQVLHFGANGRVLDRVSIPEHFLVKQPGSSKKVENRINRKGRQSNRGMEGLAISEDQKTLYGLMQSPLLQDSARKPSGKPTGKNCRLLVMNLAATGARKEFLYQLDDARNKLNEILAINDHEFLVIERDGKAGEEAAFKKIMKIDTRHATDIQNVESLPPEDAPVDVKPVKKSVFIDLLAPAFSLAGKNMPEKIEGLTFGPTQSNGTRILIVASDNDFETDSPSLFYVFEVAPSDLK